MKELENIKRLILGGDPQSFKLAEVLYNELGEGDFLDFVQSTFPKSSEYNQFFDQIENLKALQKNIKVLSDTGFIAMNGESRIFAEQVRKMVDFQLKLAGAKSIQYRVDVSKGNYSTPEDYSLKLVIDRYYHNHGKWNKWDYTIEYRSAIKWDSGGRHGGAYECQKELSFQGSDIEFGHDANINVLRLNAAASMVFLNPEAYEKIEAEYIENHNKTRRELYVKPDRMYSELGRIIKAITCAKTVAPYESNIRKGAVFICMDKTKLKHTGLLGKYEIVRCKEGQKTISVKGWNLLSNGTLSDYERSFPRMKKSEFISLLSHHAVHQVQK